MSIQVAKNRDGVPYALVRALKDTRQLLPDQTGTSAAMVAGTITISNVTLLQQSNIQLTANTAGGTQGVLRAAAAGRTTGVGTGSFVITSASGTDTSTVDWRITHQFFHGSPMLVTTGDYTNPALAAPTFPTNAVDLPTSIALTKFMKYICQTHALDTAQHLNADTTNRTTLIAIADPIDLPSVITAINGVKVFFNAHQTQASVHINNDNSNNIATANATDLPSTQTLANAIKTALALHIAHAPGGESVLLIG